MPTGIGTALLIGGIASAAGGVASSAIGASGAKSAAKTQAAAGQAVAGQIDKSTADAIKSGYAGIEQANNAIDHGLTDANAAITGNYGAANDAIAAAGKDANATLQTGLDEAKGYVKPYQTLGQQGVTGLSDMMDPTKASSVLALDPGYQFRMNEAAKTMAKQAAARGGLQSGGFAKGLGRYLQDYASNEYQNVFNRFNTLAGYGERANAQAIQAGEFFQGNQAANDMKVGGTISDNFGRVGTLLSGNDMFAAGHKSDVAMQGNQWIGTMGLEGATRAGNARMGAANATAQGQMNSANAWSQGVQTAANTPLNVWALSQLGQMPQQPPAGPTAIPVPYPVQPPTMINAGAPPTIAYNPPPLPPALQPPPASYHV